VVEAARSAAEHHITWSWVLNRCFEVFILSSFFVGQIHKLFQVLHHVVKLLDLQRASRSLLRQVYVGLFLGTFFGAFFGCLFRLPFRSPFLGSGPALASDMAGFGSQLGTQNPPKIEVFRGLRGILS